jgi:DNA-binding GntR family transcriptional regulator
MKALAEKTAQMRAPELGPGDRSASQARSERSAALAREIVDWLRRHDARRGDHVPEAPLSAAFRVSRTPIRSALAILADNGLLARQTNKGYFLIGDPATAPISGATKTSWLREAILRDRLDRRLEAETTATKLMRRYGVSRRAAQGALEQLSREGIVGRSHGPRWHFFTSLDAPQSLDQSYRFRVIIEPAAILEPEFFLDGAEAARIRSALERELARHRKGHDLDQAWSARMIELDIAFHNLLASASGNRFLEGAIRQQGELRRLALSAHRVANRRLFESLGEHLAILNAAIAGHREAASRLMRKHLLASRLARPIFANRGAPALALATSIDLPRPRKR